jgi:protein subunit release factor A
MSKPNEILFSATRKDFRVDHFSTGGPGGQNQNRKKNGVRITHIETGLSAESRTFKSEAQNKKAAFQKLGERILEMVRAEHREIREKSAVVVRTYHGADNRVKDHLSGLEQPYIEVLNDPTEMIEARAEAARDDDAEGRRDI